MSAGIFVIGADDKLTKLTEAPYETEALLQKLLAQYPELLPGDQIDATAPRRWLLVDRETGIPKEEGGGDNWSLDHLFIDQEGVPTLVEVKRSTDTRIRREVVGQMLDYAANGVVYWPIETIIAKYEARCEREVLDPVVTLEEFLGTECSREDFWTMVKTNLQAGRVRMVFVADYIPPELRRVVEFLNSQMDPAEMLAVEVKQFVGDGLRSLVPRVVGLSAQSQQKKAGTSRSANKWDEAAYFEDMAKKCDPSLLAVAKKLLTWGQDHCTYVWWGEGKTHGSFVPVFVHNGKNNALFVVWSSGHLEFYFQWYEYKPPFSDPEKLQILFDRFNAVPGLHFGPEARGKRPTESLRKFVPDTAYGQLVAVFEWMIAEIQAT